MIHIPETMVNQKQQTAAAAAAAAANEREERSMMMAHEAEIIIPGSFVVFQGNAGDGLSNIFDSAPILPLEDEYDEVATLAAARYPVSIRSSSPIYHYL